MTPFEVLEPTSLAEAIALLDPDDSAVRPIAGGTALMLLMKAGLYRPRRLVSLRRIETRYADIAITGGGLRIGAMTALGTLERSREVREAVPLVTRTLRTLSNVRVRNVATVGGALAHADPHMDLPPVLMALDATVTVAGPRGERTLPLDDLFSGYMETVLERNELIAALDVPAQGAKHACYCKVTTGAADDWPALGVAVALERGGETRASVRVVVSAATVKAMRLKAAEDVLAGGPINDKAIADAAEAAAAEAELLADMRGTVSYKRALLRVYVRRAVRQALDADGV